MSSSVLTISAPASSADGRTLGELPRPRRRQQHEPTYPAVQADGAAQLLISLTRVDAETEMSLNGLVEISGEEISFRRFIASEARGAIGLLRNNAGSFRGVGERFFALPLTN